MGERLTTLRGRKFFERHIVTGIEQAHSLCFVVQRRSHVCQIVFNGAELSLNLFRLQNGVLAALRIVAGGDEFQGGVTQMRGSFYHHRLTVAGGIHGIGQHGRTGQAQISRDLGCAIDIVDGHASVQVQMINRTIPGYMGVFMNIHRAVNEALVGQVTARRDSGAAIDRSFVDQNTLGHCRAQNLPIVDQQCLRMDQYADVEITRSATGPAPAPDLQPAEVTGFTQHAFLVRVELQQVVAPATVDQTGETAPRLHGDKIVAAIERQRYTLLRRIRFADLQLDGVRMIGESVDR